MEHIYHIRCESKTKGESLRQIARDTGHNFRTVKKYAEAEDFSEAMPVKQVRPRKRDAYKDIVKLWLKEDLEAPKKQRHTARRVYDRLVEKLSSDGAEITISQRTVRSLVSEIKAELERTEPVSLPLTHPCGEAQVDFGKTVFYERGEKYDAHHLVVTYPHAGTSYSQLFKGENSQCLFEGLSAIFEHVGGAPTVIRFDNMSTAVSKIRAYGDRKETEAMLRFKCHYGFKSVYCNPASGNEKGSVENAVGYVRRNLFVPVPTFDNLEEYNKELLIKCDAELNETHYRHGVTKSELFKEDKEKFIPLPGKRFEAVSYTEAKTNNYGIISFEKNRYSTGGSLRKSEVTVKAGAHHVEIFTKNGELIVSHRRLYGENKESVKWGPYLRVLASRPMALKYSGFYDTLGKELREFFDSQGLPERKQIMSFIADAAEERDLDTVTCGMRKALKLARGDADSFISAVGFTLNMPAHIPANAVPEGICLPEGYSLDLGMYASLMPKMSEAQI